MLVLKTFEHPRVITCDSHEEPHSLADAKLLAITVELADPNRDSISQSSWNLSVMYYCFFWAALTPNRHPYIRCSFIARISFQLGLICKRKRCFIATNIRNKERRWNENHTMFLVLTSSQYQLGILYEKRSICINDAQSWFSRYPYIYLFQTSLHIYILLILPWTWRDCFWFCWISWDRIPSLFYLRLKFLSCLHM